MAALNGPQVELVEFSTAIPPEEVPWLYAACDALLLTEVPHPGLDESRIYTTSVDSTDRRGMNRAVVARANKTARIVWAVLAKGEAYEEAA